jgi:predicted acylesterase/phospholipase RssA
MTRIALLTRGALAIVCRLLWLNLFALLAVLLVAVTLLTEQGVDLLRLSHSPRSFWGRCLELYGPMAIGSALLTLNCFLVSAVNAIQIYAAARRYRLPRKPIGVFAFVLVPVALGNTPALIASWRSRFAGASIATFATITILSFVLTRVVRRKSISGLRLPWFSRLRIVFLTPIIAIAMMLAFHVLLPPDHARAIGALGIVLLVPPLWSLTLSCVFIAVPNVNGLPSLAAVPLLAVLIAGFYVDPNVFPHAHPTPTRIMEAPGQWTLDERRGSLDSELSEWSKQFVAIPGDERIPLYLVSSEGGGIRAGYWSAEVLAEIDAKTKGEFRKHVLAFSGVSGGSLGVAAYAAAVYRNQTPPDKVVPLMRQYFANDFLSPIVVRLLTTEPLRMLFGDHSHAEPRDRAFEIALAHDWERASGQDDFYRPFLDTFGTNYRDPAEPFMPIVWFNSTIVETGLRGIVSNIQVAWIATTSTDLLRQDVADRRNLDRITVAEAVHLSARFPFVSPPATILTDVSVDPDPNHHEKRLWGHLVDGGYLDNSAADNFLEMVKFIDRQRKFALECHAHRYSDCSPEPEDQKILDVERRIQIVVLAIRNDPLDRGARLLDIPSLVSVDPDALVTASACSACSLKDGFLRDHLPSDYASREITGPPDALTATREARGVVTRDTLRAAMTEGVPNSFSGWCRTRLTKAVSKHGDLPISELSAVGLTPSIARLAHDTFAKECTDSQRDLVVSWACDAQTDFYREYSLATFLGDPKISRGQCQSVGHTEGSLRGIALGWTLSPGVQDRIVCIAGAVQPPAVVSSVGVTWPSSCGPH